MDQPTKLTDLTTDELALVDKEFGPAIRKMLDRVRVKEQYRAWSRNNPEMVLLFFLRQIGSETYFRGLVKKSGLREGVARHAMNNLLRAGLVTRRVRRNPGITSLAGGQKTARMYELTEAGRAALAPLLPSADNDYQSPFPDLISWAQKLPAGKLPTDDLN